MKRSNHYEAAVEGYLQWHRLCHVSVDETRRAFLGETSVKNLDFIVLGENSRLLVDVKGRRFPSGSPEKARRVWECWTKKEDVDGLLRWQKLFGANYCSVLLFAYLIGPDLELPEDLLDLWTWHGRRYLLRAVTVAEYHQHMRQRSPRWDTVSLPGKTFRELARPFYEFTHPAWATPSSEPQPELS